MQSWVIGGLSVVLACVLGYVTWWFVKTYTPFGDDDAEDAHANARSKKKVNADVRKGRPR